MDILNYGLDTGYIEISIISRFREYRKKKFQVYRLPNLENYEE